MESIITTIVSVIADIKYFFQHELYFYYMSVTKKYYIIRRSEGGAGFFSNYYWVMGHVIFAKKLGYIPVVDMENYPTLYSEDIPIDGTRNAWNYYFDNVGSVSLEEAYSSNRYVCGEIRHLSKYADKYSDSIYRFPSKKAIEYYSPIITKNIRIKRSLLGEFEQFWKDTILEGQVIGVHIRGTDMKNDLGHPMPADTSCYISNINKLINQHKQINYIYLATDEVTIVDQIKAAVDVINAGDNNVILVYQEAFRSDIQDSLRKTGIHEQVPENPRTNHKYLMGYEVLKDAWCLSKCDYLICGYSNIANTVILWNDNSFQELIHVK